MLFGGSLLAATVAGGIALFAPCCISVMLPAYFASSFHNRRLLVAMTFLFAAGIATVILPIALGASVLRSLIVGQHAAVYVGGGLLMIVLAAYVLLGGKLRLPTPSARRGARAGPLGVYSLGVFSGVASACCAPVLAGVVGLAGVASSFALALGLGLAYVFGMVAPLFVISLFWERVDWRATFLFRPRSFRWRLGPLRRTISGTNLAAGVLLALMGGGMAWVGVSQVTMPASTGWQARVALRLEHYGRLAIDALSWVPGWLLALALVVAVLARRALRQTGVGEDRRHVEEDVEERERGDERSPLEHQDA